MKEKEKRGWGGGGGERAGAENKQIVICQSQPFCALPVPEDTVKAVLTSHLRVNTNNNPTKKPIKSKMQTPFTGQFSVTLPFSSSGGATGAVVHLLMLSSEVARFHRSDDSVTYLR